MTKIKKVFLVAASLTALVSTPVLAADMAVKARPVPPPVPAMFSWSGIYIGGFVGGVTFRSERSYDALGDHFMPPNSGVTNDGAPAAVGGGMIGINWQVNNWVLGAEVTGAGTTINESFGAPFRSPVGSDPVSLTDKVNYIFTATGKVGWAWDRLLWYGKAGYASVGIDSLAADPVPHTAAARVRHNGWTAGTGLEYALVQNWIMGIEYDYIRVSAATHNQALVAGIAPAAPTFYNTSIRGDLHQVVGRLSYKFDWLR